MHRLGDGFIDGVKDELLHVGSVEEEVTVCVPPGEAGNRVLVGCDRVPLRKEGEYGCVIRKC